LRIEFIAATATLGERRSLKREVKAAAWRDALACGKLQRMLVGEWRRPLRLTNVEGMACFFGVTPSSIASHSESLTWLIAAVALLHTEPPNCTPIGTGIVEETPTAAFGVVACELELFLNIGVLGGFDIVRSGSDALGGRTLGGTIERRAALGFDCTPPVERVARDASGVRGSLALESCMFGSGATNDGMSAPTWRVCDA
jgi:hypothetical protein